MFTQLRNLADIASVLGTPSTLGTPNTFGTHTPKSTVAEPGTPSVTHGLCVIVITDTLVITELRST